MKDFFKELHPLAQLAIIVGICIIAYLILSRISAQIQATKRVQQNKAEVTALQQSGVTATYQDSRYRSYADELEYTMSGPGTYEEELFDVFEAMENDVDIIKLEAAFGVRGGSDLRGWLRADLSASEMSQLNTLLSNKGITKTF
jgi:hypothetical protein